MALRLRRGGHFGRFCLSFAKQAIGRIRREGWSVMPYALGRFHAVRTLYSTQSSILRGKKKQDLTKTIFPGVSVEKAVADIQKQAVYCPVTLPQDVVAELRTIAETADLEASTQGGTQHFHYADVKNAHLPNGEHVLVARVVDAKQFPAVHRVAADPIVLSVMSDYLGYTPNQWDVRLFWSFASDAALAVRKIARQTTEFHFDVYSYSFAYAAYYLLDTDRHNGAHVMIAGSHKDKPTSWLFGSANQKDEVVYAHYPKDKVLIIEGKAGTGFWQDSSCYHKALPPERSERLLFQVRYF
jgi:hypothetical protein